MGTTPRGLPYPEPNAPLREGANAMRDLALATDALVPDVDPAMIPADAWTPLGFASGWGNYGGGYAPLEIYKVGKSYLLNGMFNRIGTAIAATVAPQTVTYVPEGTLPKYQCLWIVGGYNGSAYVNVRIDLKVNGLITAQWLTAAPWNNTTWVTLAGLAYPVA